MTGLRPADAARVAADVPRLILVGVIHLWRLVVSPLYGSTCKYYPSCSAYGLQAVTEHGAARGSALALWRLLRCNPWSHGGVDDVPPARTARAGVPVADGASPDLADPGSSRSASEPASVG